MNIKQVFTVLAVIGAFFAFNSMAFAEEIACIDMTKIINNYNKAQELTAELKIKEAELEKMLADAKKDIKLAKASDKKQIEEKYNKQIKDKQNLYKDYYNNELQKVRNNIQNAIKTVAKDKNINLIFSKSSLIFGGTDLTEEVLAVLKNKQ